MHVRTGFAPSPADEGPFFQTERFDRYREIIEKWLAEGKAYHCYCTKEELAELRETQMSEGAGSAMMATAAIKAKAATICRLRH